MFEPIPASVEAVAKLIIGAAIAVHRALGPGFLEKIVELKASSKLDLVHDAKLISDLRTTGLRLGLLLNFNCRTLKDGIKRIVV